MPSRVRISCICNSVQEDISHARETRSFIAKCNDHKCRRGTSGDEEAAELIRD